LGNENDIIVDALLIRTIMYFNLIEESNIMHSKNLSKFHSSIKIRWKQEISWELLLKWC